jgi:hypothetical protein
VGEKDAEFDVGYKSVEKVAKKLTKKFYAKCRDEQEY